MSKSADPSPPEEEPSDLQRLQASVAAVGSSLLELIATRIKVAVLGLITLAAAAVMGLACVVVGVCYLARGLEQAIGALALPAWVAPLLTGALLLAGPFATVLMVRGRLRSR